MTHESYAVYRPNPVTQKSAKGSNIASLIGYQGLASSPFLQLVWSRLIYFHLCCVACFCKIGWMLLKGFSHVQLVFGLLRGAPLSKGEGDWTGQAALVRQKGFQHGSQPLLQGGGLKPLATAGLPAKKQKRLTRVQSFLHDQV